MESLNPPRPHLRATDIMHIHTYSHIYTGWRRLIGSPKLQVIFRKRATNYRALLWKVTYEDKGSYESSPPCIHTYSPIYSICTCAYII